MRGATVPGNAWAAVQHGLTEMLVSAAAKRRAGIEMRPAGVDADVVAADNQIARYKTVLKSRQTSARALVTYTCRCQAEAMR
jgi:hypothetical protein